MKGRVYVLCEEGKITGTGSFDENHVTRVYVRPENQGKGYGSYIMDQLEKEIALNFDTAVLDASLPACRLYERRGYRTLRHEQIAAGKSSVLVYEVMEKCFEELG